MRGVEERECVSSFVTNGGHTKSANLENMVPHAGLTIRDILNLGEFDDVGRIAKEWGANCLNGAAIRDVEMIGIINSMTSAAAEEQEEIESDYP